MVFSTRAAPVGVNEKDFLRIGVVKGCEIISDNSAEGRLIALGGRGVIRTGSRCNMVCKSGSDIDCDAKALNRGPHENPRKALADVEFAGKFFDGSGVF